MFGSVLGRAVEVGEPDVVVGAGVVVVGEEPAVLEGDALGFVSPPHPANNIDAASGTASRAAEAFFAAEVFLVVEACFAVEIDFTVVNCTASPTVKRTERWQHAARRFFG